MTEIAGVALLAIFLISTRLVGRRLKRRAFAQLTPQDAQYIAHGFADVRRRIVLFIVTPFVILSAAVLLTDWRPMTRALASVALLSLLYLPLLSLVQERLLQLEAPPEFIRRLMTCSAVTYTGAVLAVGVLEFLVASAGD
jgi:hypothetical protein